MTKFNIRQTREILTGQSGLALVGSLLHQSNFKFELDNLPMPANRGATLKNSDIAVSMIGLLAQGRCDFEHIELFRKDRFFPLALNLSRTPSAAILRQRLDTASEKWDAAVRRASVWLLKNKAMQSPCYKNFIPVDVDVSPMDNSGSNKEGVSCTYKKINGYAPLFFYIGQEGYMLNLDFREGKQHSQCAGTVSFFEQSFDMLAKLRHRNYLFRADSAHDCLDNYIAIEKFNKEHKDTRLDFIVKHNLRREPKDAWFDIAQKHGTKTEPRNGKVVYTGKTSREYKGLDLPLTLVFQVTERTISKTGQHLLIPDIEVDVYVTTLHDEEAGQVIELYHKHGTSEQFHSELKTDIGLERLPSGRFATNQRVMFLALLAFNLLRIMGQETLDYKGHPIKNAHRIKRRRLGSTIRDLIYHAARLIRHARQWTLGFGYQSPFFETFQHLYFKWTG
jgi:hypothetical protein